MKKFGNILSFFTCPRELIMKSKGRLDVENIRR